MFRRCLRGVPCAECTARVDALLDTVGLQEHDRVLVFDLPGGWQQRLALACATVHRPQVLFPDEPTGGAQREFWNLIDTLTGEEVTVFVKSHFVDEAEHYNLDVCTESRLCPTCCRH